jgi:hypothetical protein
MVYEQCIFTDCSYWQSEGVSGKFMFWDVFREFPISQWVLTQFTLKIDRYTQLIYAELVIEKKQ